MKCISVLQEKLLVNSILYIDGNLVCVKDSYANHIEVLEFIKKHHDLQELFLYTWITLCILLAIPVTVSSGK